MIIPGWDDPASFCMSYIVAMIQSAMAKRSGGVNMDGRAGRRNRHPLQPSILLLWESALAIAFGGDLTVDAASRIAIDLGMSQTLVGLTIVSLASSWNYLFNLTELLLSFSPALFSRKAHILCIFLSLSERSSPNLVLRQALLLGFRRLLPHTSTLSSYASLRLSSTQFSGEISLLLIALAVQPPV